MNQHDPQPDGVTPATPSASPADGYPGSRPVVVALVVTALFVLTQLYASIPLLGPLATRFGADATFALSTGFSVTYAVGFLIWGPVSDRYGRKKVMAIAIGVLSVATLACAFAPSLATLAGLRALQGLSAAGFAPVALAYLTEAVPPRRRAGAVGAMSAAFLVAGIFGQVAASVIALRMGWPWFFGICGLVLVVAFAVILVLVAEASRTAPSASLWNQFGKLGGLLVKPAILLLSLAHVTLLLSFVALYTGIGQHLENLGVAASDIVLIRLAALPAMFVSLLAGTVARRLGVIGGAQLGFGLAALGMLGEVVLSGTLIGLVLMSVVYVAGVALAIPSMINLYGETAAPNRASGMAINGFILFIGASIGPILGGAITGFTALTLVLVGFLVFASVSLIGVAVITRKAAIR
jgi:MFS transporter, YNFM family, putative membrane transport protein